MTIATLSARHEARIMLSTFAELWTSERIAKQLDHYATLADKTVLALLIERGLRRVLVDRLLHGEREELDGEDTDEGEAWKA